jgi:hypothetical protein
VYYGWFTVRRSQEGVTRNGEPLCQHLDCPEAAESGEAVCVEHQSLSVLFWRRHGVLAVFLRRGAAWTLAAIGLAAWLLLGSR